MVGALQVGHRDQYRFVEVAWRLPAARRCYNLGVVSNIWLRTYINSIAYYTLKSWLQSSGAVVARAVMVKSRFSRRFDSGAIVAFWDHCGQIQFEEL